MQTAKEAVKSIIERIPDQASWDDIMYELYVKQKVEAGLRAVEAGRSITHDEVCKMNAF